MYWNDHKPDGITVCPIDHVHTVPNSRLQYHLVQCRKNHPNTKFYTCDYNWRHLFRNKDQYQEHVKSCPDAQLIDRDMEFHINNRREPLSGCVDAPPVVYGAFEDAYDSWDSEVSDASATALGAHAAQQFKPTTDETQPAKQVKFVRKRRAMNKVQSMRLPTAAPDSTALLPREKSDFFEPPSEESTIPFAGRGRGLRRPPGFSFPLVEPGTVVGIRGVSTGDAADQNEDDDDEEELKKMAAFRALGRGRGIMR